MVYLHCFGFKNNHSTPITVIIKHIIIDLVAINPLIKLIVTARTVVANPATAKDEGKSPLSTNLCCAKNVPSIIIQKKTNKTNGINIGTTFATYKNNTCNPSD